MMTVNTNVAALNAWQNLNNTQSSLGQVLLELSSGNRINKAADDPAGLAISQQMMTQIDGMQQAYQDSQAGISLLQTTDGALGQIQNILQSMRSLASEAATGTNNSTDLTSIQTEMNQYVQEITQITNNTQFNNVNLLGGAFTSQNIQVGANQNQNLSVSLNAADAFTLKVTSASVSGTDGSNLTNGLSNASSVGLSNGSYTLTGSTQAWSVTNYKETDSVGQTVLTTITGKYNGTSTDAVTFSFYTSSSTAATSAYTDNSGTGVSVANTGTANIPQFVLDGVTFTLAATTGLTASSTYTVFVDLNPAATSATVTGGGVSLATASNVNGAVTLGSTYSATATGESLTFYAGSGLVSQSTAGTASYNPTSTTVLGSATYGGSGYSTTSGLATLVATVSVALTGTAASSYTNGTGNGTATNALDITNQSNAQAALSVIDTAVNTLSTERANVGAYQNRLQFASSDLQTIQENLQAARAGITEADMALEMSNLSRYQILQQTGVAMLAQANSMPQALLKLLA